MIFNIQLVVFIVLNFKSNNVEGGCSGASICNWIRWEPWSDCSVTCGGGTRRRYRNYCCKLSLASDTNACMKNCHHDMSYFYRYNSESQSCNTFCYNGYYWNNACSCSDAFYGSCCGNPCPQIDNCKRRRCTYSRNTKCLECNDDKIFSKKTSGDTKCERLCSWNNHYCWPGKCGEDLTRECTCAQDFKIVQKSGETSCQPKKLPSILTCETVVVGPNMEKKQARSSTNSRECQYLADMYGNFQPSLFKFDVAAEYTVNITAFTNPDFISESKFGITDFSIDIVKILVDGRRSVESRINRILDISSSVNCTQTHFDSDNITVTSSNFNLQDGQALCLQFRVDAGGYLKSINRITHKISEAVPYRKVQSTRQLCYKYDISPAMHCQEKGNCSYDPIQFKNRVTRSADIDIDFKGWYDPLPPGGNSIQASSIESYQITVNEVTVSTNNKVNYLSNVYTKKVDFKEKRIPLNLPSEKPRLYCVNLEVKDVADNVKQARRFILYDNSSFIETRDDKPFYFTSASIQTNYKWQTHHHDLCLNWKDHFLNRFYFDNPLLNPIAPEPLGLVSGIYEQNDGLLPVSGTPNVYGIVQTLVSWTLNDGSPSSEIKVPNFQNQSFCKDLKVKDGQTYTIFIRSIDIANNTFIENRTVHIDRSVPHINNIWLVKDGNKVLFVDTMTDFSKMYLQFEALDPHSGVRQIEWAFGNTTTELTSGFLSVGSLREKSCPQNAESCYCPDVGQCEIFNYTVPLNKLILINKHVDNHNRNYYFTLKVTNNAYLFNIERVDVFINNSQPVLGVNFEECPHIAHCKRRRCKSPWDTKCLECNYDKILFKKTQNDTKCEQIPQTFTLHLEHPPSKDHDLTCNAVTLKCTTGCIFLTPSFIWYYLQSDGLESIWSDSEPVTHTSGQCKEFEVVFTSTLVLQKYTVFNDNTDHTVRFQCRATILNGTTDEVKTQSSVNIRFAVRVAKVSLKIGSSSSVSSLNVTDGISEIFKCTTSDSRPLPTIVWYIGRTEKIRVVGTESTLAFIPSIADTGKDVYCKAFNIQPENEALFSNKVSLHVKERTSVNLLYFDEHVGETNVTIDENYVNLQLTCNISGNPASSVEIKFEEKSLIKKANINQLSFVRQKVACFHSGEYTCVGKDTLGMITNKTLYLFVNCSPRPDWQAISNTTCSIGAPVTLTFTAFAYPTPSYDGFNWYKKSQMNGYHYKVTRMYKYM